jgi:heme A synthase
VKSGLPRFAWGVLAYNLAVILWGAYVRATGSGAGCGAHWPLCNGQVIPLDAGVKTLVEFSHRASSGLALAAVVALLVWTWRARPAGHVARKGAALSAFFILTEAGVGAALVLLELVADNASMARAMFMAIHLINTFLLVASLTLTAWWLSGGAPVRVGARRGTAALLAIGALGLMLVGVSGAIAALGDTLFPAQTLADALEADLSPTSHLLIRLRLLHPALALVVAFGFMFTPRAVGPTGSHAARTAARFVVALTVVQVAAGFVNVVLLAPVWLQMVHLLLADATWIAFVLFTAAALASDEAS